VQIGILYTCTAVPPSTVNTSQFQFTSATLHCLAIKFAQYKLKIISAAMHYSDI